jgi:hypothetical protein
MKPAALLFTLLFVTMIALSLTAHLKKKKLTTDAKATQTLIQPFSGVVTVNSALPTISLGNSVGAFGTGNFTLAFWFQTNGSSAGLSDVIGNRQQGSCGNYLGVRLSNTGVVSVDIMQDTSCTNWVELVSSSGLNDGNGHHFAFVRSGSALTLYIDGAVSSSGSGTPASITGLYPFQLGVSYSGASPLSISFADLRIYYSALTATQITALKEDVAFEDL